MRTKASAESPFASVFAPETGPVALVEQTGRQIKTICSYCPDWDWTAPENKFASHGLCDTCARKLDAQIEAMERAK